LGSTYHRLGGFRDSGDVFMSRFTGWTKADIAKLQIKEQEPLVKESLKKKYKRKSKSNDIPEEKWKVDRAVCEICGEKFYTAPCYKKRGVGHGRFCSNKCKGIYSSEQNKLKFAEFRKKRLAEKKQKILAVKQKKKEIENQKTPCKYCGKLTLKKFCNWQCYIAYKKSKTGENNIIKNCLTCNAEFVATPGQHNAGYAIYCSINCSAIKRAKDKVNVFVNSKSGKRADLDNKFFRSRWEANYARYLNFLVKNGEIKKWEFEPETFWFNEIKRGTRSYLPDFKIYKINEAIEYHEVKGYMDKKSQTKLNRMAKYYPNIKIVLIDKKRYMALHRQMKDILPNWEIDNSPKKKYLYK
jgi:hypothetical protein